MSILDLLGGTHTITTDSIETYWKVIDSVGGGHLVQEPGSQLQFIDQEDAGFDPLTEDFTWEILGDAEALCYVRSEDSLPHHPWALPPTSITMSATRCVFWGATGEWNPLWTLNACRVGGDGYCTVNDVRAMTGVSSEGAAGVADYRIELFVRNATDQIDEMTGRVWDERNAANEVHDHDGAQHIRMRNRPILSITSLEYRENDTWVIKEMDPEGDYWASELDLDQGIIRLIESPGHQLQSIRVNYTYGATSVPYKIRRICMMMAAIETYRAVTSPGTSNIYQLDIQHLQEEIAKFEGSIGGDFGMYVSAMAPEKLKRGSTMERLWQ